MVGKRAVRTTLLAALSLQVALAGCSGAEETAGLEWSRETYMPGTQITLFEIDENQDGRTDVADLSDGYGAQSIFARIDSNFDGRWDIYRYAINGRDLDLGGYYWDLGCDGVLDVGVIFRGSDMFDPRSQQWWVYFESRWVPAEVPEPARKEHFDSYERGLVLATYTLEGEFAGVAVKYEEDQERMVRLP